MASSARPGTGPSEEFRFPGNRLGLPEHGPGSVASWGRRILALLLDWLIAGLIASAVTSKPIWAGGNDFNTAQLITFFAMTAILTGLGHNLVHARSGTEALQRLMEIDFAAILLDVNMPGMDGFAATRALRGDAVTKDIPVVLVTAKDQKADKAWGQMLGAKGYITKPYTDDQILTQVRAL